ncbi:GNAT family N-acetyltransferase [Massilia sp. S19_KUP03_FR1]|uniref:GNAT family N-acetyltransferase n=1 Tax=Massilia sp. S19_KUP03_FR1 TaxID=3025503 RepID=UPI002FCDB908
MDTLANERTHASTAVQAATSPSPSIVDVTINERVFGIRAADIDDRRNSASVLINKMYAWRGYAGSHQIVTDPNRITLTASDKGEVIGTLSLGLDSSVRLLADQVFQDLIDPIRANGRVCELIKFAIDPSVKSRAVLASLFHVAFIYARDLNNCSDIFIEVNPRHRRFYERLLKFRVVCEPRDNPRVQAPAVLMHMNTDYGTSLIAEWAGRTDDLEHEHSLFPYFFSQREEVGIINRLKLIG